MNTVNYEISKTKRTGLVVAVLLLASFALFRLIFVLFFEEYFRSLQESYFYVTEVMNMICYLLIYSFFLDYFKYWKQSNLCILAWLLVISTLIEFVFTLMVQFNLIELDFLKIQFLGRINFTLILSFTSAIVILTSKLTKVFSTTYLRNIAICIIIHSVITVIIKLNYLYTALSWKGSEFIGYFSFISFGPKIMETVYLILFLYSLKKSVSDSTASAM